MKTEMDLFGTERLPEALSQFSVNSLNKKLNLERL